MISVVPSRKDGTLRGGGPGVGGSDASFGIALATIEGAVFAAGDCDALFPIQSVSKVFTLALVVAGCGDKVWTRVSREPSGTSFNSLVQLEYERGIPRNPFINAGALVVTDQLLSMTGNASGYVRDLLRREADAAAIDVVPAVVALEHQQGHRNASLAHLLASYGNLDNPVDAVLEHYFAHCALSLNCRQLARAGLFLARNGVCSDGSALLTTRQTKRINAVMLTCGTYDAAGEFAYRVGLPCKSGVSGAVIAIIPGRCSIAVWGPPLDKFGNSITGLAALDELTTRTGWSIF